MNIAKTKLTYAMHSLITEIPFEKITVQTITKKAGVSKATFYRVFHDKYELMNWCYQEQVDKLLQKLVSTSWRIIHQEILQFIYNNKDYYSKVIQVEGQNSFLDFLYEYSLAFCKREYLKWKDSKILSKEEVMILEFYSAGAIFIVKKWIDRKFELSIEEISELIFQLIPEIMKPALV